MEVFKSLLCESYIAMIVCYVLDIILILMAIGLFIWYYIKNSNKVEETEETTQKSESEVEQINDDTYVIPNEVEETKPEEFVQKDNAVEHFSNQLTGINQTSSQELKSNAVVVKHEVEQHIKKPVKKEEISNYVMIDGIQKQKTVHEKEKSFNRGTNAFKDSTNFLNTIKEINDEASTTAKAKKTTKKSTKK